MNDTLYKSLLYISVSFPAVLWLGFRLGKVVARVASAEAIEQLAAKLALVIGERDFLKAQLSASRDRADKAEHRLYQGAALKLVKRGDA